MASGGNSSSNGEQGVATLNPASLIFGESLGIPSTVNRQGGLSFGMPGVNQGLGLANRSFNTGAFDALGSLADPMNPFQLDIPGAANYFGNQAIDLFGGSILPAARELADTGFKTDIQPAVDFSKYLFQNEFLPGAAEQFGQAGLGPGDSDFGAAIAREAGRRSNELGALDVQLSEAAAGRRAAGLPWASQVPTGLGDLLYGFEQSSRQAQRAASPGGQLWDLLMAASGLNTQGQGTGKQDSQSFNMGILA